MSDDERARRVGLNEALYRQVNEQITSLNRELGERGTMDVICECGDGECVQRLELDLETYERVRADPRQYVIVPGHEIPDFETVVDDGEGYDVVRKLPGPPAELSDETDPRS